MWYNKDESWGNRYLGGGGGVPKLKAPEPAPKAQETRRVVEAAGEERKKERKRKPPGRKSTIFAGIDKALKDRLGL